MITAPASQPNEAHRGQGNVEFSLGNGETRRPNALVARVLQVNDKKSRITGGRPEA